MFASSADAGTTAMADGDNSSLLSVPLTSFIGREAEIEAVLALLDDPVVRLLTLTGPGGVGKTRLAIEVAHWVEGDFADGSHVLRLDAIRDPVLVVPAVAQALDLSQRGDRPLLDALVHELRDRHLLLVLDNFEHLLDAAPVWLAKLLGACPRIKALVTSRAALRIGGEHRYEVPPLPVPDAVTGTKEGAAITLFAQRARAVRPDFALDDTDIDTVAEICRRLEGLPLAIELAAARTKVLPPAELLSRLSDRFVLLTGGDRDAPPRLRSLRDAIAWSYDVLATDEQRLFRQLSVFVGGFTLVAAEAVCSDGDIDVLGGVASLVDKSLARPVTGTDGGARFLMLETIREFATEQLAASGEEDDVRDHHAMWFLDFASTDASVFSPFVSAGEIKRLSAEHANYRAALTWLDASGRESDLTTLVNRLRWIWNMGAHYAEGVSWYERVLKQPTDRPAILQCDLLTGVGVVAHHSGSSSARGYLEGALRIARDAGDVLREAEATAELAIIAEDTGHYAEAEAGFRRAHTLYGRVSDPWNQVWCEYHLGIVAYGAGDLLAARRSIEGAEVVAERLHAQFIPVWCRYYLCLIACDEGDADSGMALLARQRRAVAAGTPQDIELLVALAGAVATVQSDYVIAARLFGAQGAVAQTWPLQHPERDAIERYADLAREHLGSDRYDAAWTEGRRLRPSEIDAEIDRLLSGERESQRQLGQSDRIATDLSPRELEVLRLLADGLTNQEIADALFVSRRTASTHIDHILTKLTLRSRTAAVAFAIRNGLA